MATSLGSLVVSLGLNAVEYTTGLTRAEIASQKAMKKIKDDIDGIAKAFGIAAVAVGAFAIKMGHDFIEAAANLDDMAEKTGASVEELSKLSQQAYISGTALETVEQTLIQLSKHLQGSGEESKNTTRALAALGLEASELKNLDTAQALQRIAVELNKFEDGAGKSALAMDLLGKAGAQALPFLKDMANDGALAATVTAKQAAEAEALGKEWRKLALEAKNVGQAIALDIIPWLRDLIDQFAKGIQIAGGFGEALRLFGLSTITKGNSADKIGEITTEIGKLQEKLSDKRFSAPNWQSSINKQMDDLKKQLEYAKVLATQAEAGGRRWDEEQGSPGPFQKPIDYKTLPDTAKAAAAAEKYREMLVGLASQLRTVNGEETELQKVREKMAADKDFLLIPAKQREQLRGVIELTAQQIDQAKDQKKALDATNKSWVAYIDAETEAYETTLRTNAELVKSPKQLTDIANALKLTLDPLHEYKDQWADINDLVAQGKITELQGQLAKLPGHIRELVSPTENVSQQIQRLWEAGRISTEQMQTAVQGVLGQMEKAEDASKDFAHAIGTAFEDAILSGDKFRDVLKGLIDDIARIALRVSVTKPLETALTGAFSQGLSGIFGGTGRSGGATGGSIGYGTIDPTMSGVLGAYATGTDYVPRTGPYLLHQGESVIPASQNGSSTIDARTYVDARGATQDAIPGIVAALTNHGRAIQGLVANDGYRRADHSRQRLRR